MNFRNLSGTYRKTTVLFLSVVFFFVLGNDAAAQKRFSKSYPASKNVRLQLTNRTGMVTVEGWNKAEVSVSAYLEAPAANISPQNLSGTIYINLVKDNQGRSDVGSVNFTVRVPYSSTVDIETRMGDLKVNNIGGGLVRAKISSDGDITLTNITASNVDAGTTTGDVFFDGELKASGIYRFNTTKGNINLRIPQDSSFSLVATAPLTRSISLGPFLKTEGLNFGDGRRIYGKVGNGSANLTITNQRGSIAFIRR